MRCSFSLIERKINPKLDWVSHQLPAITEAAKNKIIKYKPIGGTSAPNKVSFDTSVIPLVPPV